MAGREPDTKPSTAGDLLRKIRKKFDLSHEFIASHINQSPGSIGHWETGRTCPKREYLIGLIKFYITYETSQINGDRSYTRFISRDRANQLLKAFKYSDIETSDIGVYAWWQWVEAEEKSSEYSTLLQINVEGIDAKSPEQKDMIVRGIKRILKILEPNHK